eukprot:scaffold241_cov234-Chaetoceros_neogracile.AAC.6
MSDGKFDEEESNVLCMPSRLWAKFNYESKVEILVLSQVRAGISRIREYPVHIDDTASRVER